MNFADKNRADILRQAVENVCKRYAEELDREIANEEKPKTVVTEIDDARQSASEGEEGE